MSKKLKVHFAVGGLVGRKYENSWSGNITYKPTDKNQSCCPYSTIGTTFEPDLVTCKLCLKQMEKRGIRPELYIDIDNLPPDVKLMKTIRDNIDKLTPGYKLIVIDGNNCLVEEEKASDTQLSIGETLTVFEVEINVKSKTYGFQAIK